MNRHEIFDLLAFCEVVKNDWKNLPYAQFLTANIKSRPKFDFYLIIKKTWSYFLIKLQLFISWASPATKIYYPFFFFGIFFWKTTVVETLYLSLQPKPLVCSRGWRKTRFLSRSWAAVLKQNYSSQTLANFAPTSEGSDWITERGVAWNGTWRNFFYVIWRIAMPF